MLYYFHKQPFNQTAVNSLYVGIGGMGTVSGFLGQKITERSRAGAIIGYDFNIGKITTIAPELRLVFNQNGDVLPALGVVLRVGR